MLTGSLLPDSAEGDQEIQRMQLELRQCKQELAKNKRFVESFKTEIIDATEIRTRVSARPSSSPLAPSSPPRAADGGPASTVGQWAFREGASYHAQRLQSLSDTAAQMGHEANLSNGNAKRRLAPNVSLQEELQGYAGTAAAMASPPVWGLSQPAQAQAQAGGASGMSSLSPGQSEVDISHLLMEGYTVAGP